MAKPKKVPGRAELKAVAVESVENVFKDVKARTPKVFEAIRKEAAGAVMGHHSDAVKAVFKVLADDILSFKDGKIDQVSFDAKLEERRNSIFGLFMVTSVSGCKPTDQKILDSVARIVGTLRRAKSLL